MSAHPMPDGIMQLGTGFWGSKTLLSAAELGVFTELARQPLDARGLQERLGLHPRSARDFFDALVALGMLRRVDGRYSNTPETDLYLDREKSSYIGGWLEMMNHRLYRYWGSLTEGLRTGLPQNEAKEGGDFFGTLYSDPARLKSFLQSMTGLSMGASQRIAQQFPWGDDKTFIDVGAAQGGEPRRADFRELYLRRRRQGSGDDAAHGAPGEAHWNNPHSIDGPARGETWGSVSGFGGQDPTRQEPDLVRSGCLSCRRMAAGRTSNVRGTASGSLRS